MGTQTLLSLDEPFVPRVTRTLPRLWIRAIHLHASKKQRLREIALSPGLNVIWAPDVDGDAKLGDRIGHGAGKTLLCRLIRHALGEPDVASPRDAEALRRRFPDGFATVELQLEGEDWAVTRPFDPSRASTAYRAGEEVGYDALVDALRGHVSGVGPLDPYRAALAWGSRDQERRFSGPLAWRDRAACPRSKLARVANADRAAAVRALLGLRDADDLAAEEALAALERREKTVVEQLAESEREIAWLAARLGSELGLEGSPTDPLVVRATVKELEAALAAVDALDGAPLREADEALEAAVRASVEAQAALASEPTTKTKKARAKAEAAARRAHKRLEAARASVAEARDAALRGSREAWAAARDRLTRARELERHLERRTRLVGERAALGEKIADARDAREQSARRHAKRLGHVQRVYDFVVRRVAGQEARGQLAIGPAGLDAAIEMADGRRGTSPALRVLATLALDFTAMILACEEGSPLPGLWIHDSPREADLARSHYDALFRLVSWLEERTARPGFQYLITSTTRPPSGAAWCALKLGAATPEELLLGQRL